MASSECPRCHQPLFTDAPQGLCPFCLLQAASDAPEATGSWNQQPEPDTKGEAERSRQATVRETWKELCETVSRDPAAALPPREGSPRNVALTAVVTLEEFLKALIAIKLMERAEARATFERFAIEASPSAAECWPGSWWRAATDGVPSRAILQGKSRGLAIGNYLILDKLGKGGMGLVFKALHRRLKRVVVLKVLPPSFAREDAAVFRFHREVEAVAKLGHPNIVAAFDADEFNGLHFFAMELVEGNDLHSLVKTDGPMSADQAIECLTQAAQGLKAAHEKGIYHRDIKPSNLMLDSNGTVKILDLGLARMEKEADVLFGLAETDPGLTIPGGMMGTVSFMPPEQAVDASAADHRSDIYSLGCTFYFLLTGTPPYSGATLMECVAAHREHPIPQLRDVWPETPPYLDSMLQRMLAKEPEDRYQSINALLDDLKACRAAVPEVHPNLPAIAVPILDHDAEIKAVTRTNASIRSVGFLAACVLLAAVAAVAVRVSQDQGRARTTSRPRSLHRRLRLGLPNYHFLHRRHQHQLSPRRTPRPNRRRPNRLARSIGSEATNGPAWKASASRPMASTPCRRAKTERCAAGTSRPAGKLALRWFMMLPSCRSRFRPTASALSGCRDKTVRLWDVKTGQELARFSKVTRERCTASPSRRMGALPCLAAETRRFVCGTTIPAKRSTVATTMDPSRRWRSHPTAGLPSPGAETRPFGSGILGSRWGERSRHSKHPMRFGASPSHRGATGSCRGVATRR